MGYVARPKVLRAKQGSVWAGHMDEGKGDAMRNEKKLVWKNFPVS